MKIRIKFSKQGDMKFIGHLDLMRFFQKAIRRSGIAIRFSEGLSPHMIMSFASPLGVGLTTSGDYVDIEITSPISTREALCRLNREMAEGMEILDFRQIDEGKASKAMSLVYAADYTVRFREGTPLPEGWADRIGDFLAQTSIQAQKEGKKGPAVIDIRPMICRMTAEEGTLKLRVLAGSAANLKPELLMESFRSFTGGSWSEYALLINREDLMAEGFVSLNDLGEVIT